MHQARNSDLDKTASHRLTYGQRTLRRSGSALASEALQRAGSRRGWEVVGVLGKGLYFLGRIGFRLAIAWVFAFQLFARVVGEPQSYDKARALYVEGKYAEAAPLFSEAARADPNNLDAEKKLAFCHLFLGQHEEAIPSFERVLTANPSDFEARLALADAFRWSGKYDKAIEQCRLVLSSEPGNKDALLKMAETMAWAGELAQARREYERILRQEPGNFEGRLGLARVSHWQGRDTEAATVYEALVASTPQDMTLRREYAEALAGAGLLSDAANQYKVVLSNLPQDFGATVGLGRALLWQDKVNQAAPYIDKALSMRPDDPVALQAKAELLRAEGKLHRARDTAKKSVSLDPKKRALPLLRVLDRELAPRAQANLSVSDDNFHVTVREALIQHVWSQADALWLRVGYGRAEIAQRNFPTIDSRTFLVGATADLGWNWTAAADLADRSYDNGFDTTPISLSVSRKKQGSEFSARLDEDQEVAFVPALQNEISYDAWETTGEWPLGKQWTASGGYHRRHYTDGNRRRIVTAGLMRELRQAPAIRLGYQHRDDETRFPTLLYYSPSDYVDDALVLTVDKAPGKGIYWGTRYRAALASEDNLGRAVYHSVKAYLGGGKRLSSSYELRAELFRTPRYSYRSVGLIFLFHL